MNNTQVVIRNDMTKLVKILYDVLENRVDQNTIITAKELENNPEIWKNLSFVRLLAGVPDSYKNFESITKDARWEIEDDLKN